MIIIARCWENKGLKVQAEVEVFGYQQWCGPPTNAEVSEKEFWH